MLPNKHQRKEIRDVIVTILTGNTTAANNVFANRYIAIEKKSLPAICIYTNKEQIEKFNEQLSKRTLTLSIEIHTSKKDETDMVKELELITGEIEENIIEYEDLEGNCNSIELISTDIVVKNDGDEPIGAALMSYNVEYFTTFVAESPDDGLEGVNLLYENSTTGNVDLPQE